MSIETGIQLQDQFSGVIQGVISSVNLAISAIYDMQQAMSMDVNMSSQETARENISQTSAALVSLNKIMAAPAASNPPVPSTPQPPAEMSAVWNADRMDVFQGSGAERFRQEAQSASEMLERLSQTQDNIARQAMHMDILPFGAFQDMNSLAVRIDHVRNRIQQIENNPLNMGSDQANAKLEQLRAQLSRAVQEQDILNQAMQDMDASAVNEAYLRLSQIVADAQRHIRDNVDEQGRFNSQIQDGTSQTSGLMQAIKGMAAEYMNIQTVKDVLNISDELTQTTTRLEMMNGVFQEMGTGFNSTDEMLHAVYASAQNARGSFWEMAEIISSFGINAGDSFGSSAEVVDFANLIKKQMLIAGMGSEESANAMLQLSQALGSGVQNGDELNSIFEQAPNLLQNIADYMDVPIGQIKQMASEGQLSADILKSAVFAASDEINSNFEQVAMTWGQVWQSIQNTALIAFQPVLEKINQIANSEGFQNFVDGVMAVMGLLAMVVMNIFDLIGTVGSFIADNWSIISPIIYGVVAALAVYYGRLLLVRGMEMLCSVGSAALAIGKGLLAAAIMMVTGCTWAEANAQMNLNNAMYACPIVWIIMLVIALIAIFYAAVAAINKFANTSLSATGIICGVLAVAAAFIGNQIIMVINFIIDAFCVLWNFIAIFANFFANVFDDPVGSIARLFFDLVDCILELLESLASAIDTIFGSNLAGAVSGWRSSLDKWVDRTFGEGEEIVKQVNASDYHLDRFDYSDAWDFGNNLGKGIENSISNLFDGTDDMPTNNYVQPVEPYGGAGGGGVSEGIDASNAAGNIADIKESVSVSQEELKYLRDLAEQETVNRFTIAEIKIDQSGMTNTINNGANDLDGFVSGLTNAVNEAVENITEGVHK